MKACRYPIGSISGSAGLEGEVDQRCLLLNVLFYGHPLLALRLCTNDLSLNSRMTGVLTWLGVTGWDCTCRWVLGGAAGSAGGGRRRVQRGPPAVPPPDPGGVHRGGRPVSHHMCCTAWSWLAWECLLAVEAVTSSVPIEGSGCAMLMFAGSRPVVFKYFSAFVAFESGDWRSHPSCGGWWAPFLHMMQAV